MQMKLQITSIDIEGPLTLQVFQLLGLWQTRRMRDFMKNSAKQFQKRVSVNILMTDDEYLCPLALLVFILVFPERNSRWFYAMFVTESQSYGVRSVHPLR